MYTSTEFVRRAFYSLELKHQICKEHLENGLSLRGCVRKYELSSHSLVQDWLRQLGYIPGTNRRTRSAYIDVQNFKSLPGKNKKKQSLTPEQQEVKILKREVE